MPPTKTWKDIERKVAKLFGGKRVGNRGLHTEAEDVEHDTLSFEVKHRKALPKGVMGWYAQACANCPEGKVPVLIMHEHGSREMVAVLSASDLARLVCS